MIRPGTDGFPDRNLESGAHATLCADRPPQRPTVSVIICAYTGDRWDQLVLAVTSAQSQSEPPDEIVVVIDHNDALHVRARTRLHGVKVVQNRHEQGLSGARNTGVSVAVGDIVAFLDDDAYAASDWLAELIAPFADPGVLGVGGQIVPKWATARPDWFPPEFDWVVGCTYRGMPTTRSVIRNHIGANMSLRRESVIAAGGFATNLGRIGTRPLGCEETELCIRLHQANPGGVHLYEPAARVWHCIPDARARWSYFRARCYAEGLSKAAVSDLTGSGPALASERSYLTATVPLGMVRQLGAGLHGRIGGFGAALAMALGSFITAFGYAVGTAAVRHAKAGPFRTRRPLIGAARFAGLPLAAVLWLVSLPRIDLARMGDYGLLPLLPLTFWAALVVLLTSFAVTVRRAKTPTWLLAGHVVAFIVIVHATPSLLYPELRYSWAWKHVGLVDYFQRHAGLGTLPHELMAYQYWPAFFNLNATLVKAGGLPSALGYAAWVPPIINLMVIAPLYLIMRTFTSDRRLVWTAIAVFFLGSWVGQDYFSPQAIAFFLYLTIIALVLRYLHRDDSARQRRAVALVGILPMMVAMVPTHQLTPLVVICALGGLAIFRVRSVVVLTIVMIGLTAGWDLIFAAPFVSQNTAGLLAAFGNLRGNVGEGMVQLADVSHSQVVVARMDRAASAGIWVLAVIGFIRRFRRHREMAFVILALAPMPLIVSNDYGGEMIFRVYLMGLPFAAAYAAAAFFPSAEAGRVGGGVARSWTTPVKAVALPVVLVLLLVGFSFGYYGKEQTSYFPREEYDSALFVNGIAPRGSLIISATSGFPWAFKNLEFYDHMWFSTFLEKDRKAIMADPVGQFRAMMSTQRHHHSYLILTQSQNEDMRLSGDLPPDAIPKIVQALSHSPQFTVIYQNSRAVVITLSHETQGGVR